MKRFRKLVIGGIETKIFNLILITVVLLTVAFMAVSVYHGNMLSDLAVQSIECLRTIDCNNAYSTFGCIINESHNVPFLLFPVPCGIETSLLLPPAGPACFLCQRICLKARRTAG